MDQSRLTMKFLTRLKLHLVWMYCDEEDKSTEHMLAFMAGEAGVSYEVAVDFVANVSADELDGVRQLFAEPDEHG